MNSHYPYTITSSSVNFIHETLQLKIKYFQTDILNSIPRVYEFRFLLIINGKKKKFSLILNKGSITDVSIQNDGLIHKFTT